MGGWREESSDSTLMILALNFWSKIQINEVLVRVAVLPLLTGSGKSHFKFSPTCSVLLEEMTIKPLEKLRFSLSGPQLPVRSSTRSFTGTKEKSCFNLLPFKKLCTFICSEYVETTILPLEYFCCFSFLLLLLRCFPMPHYHQQQADICTNAILLF